MMDYYKADETSYLESLLNIYILDITQDTTEVY